MDHWPASSTRPMRPHTQRPRSSDLISGRTGLRASEINRDPAMWPASVLGLPHNLRGTRRGLKFQEKSPRRLTHRVLYLALGQGDKSSDKGKY